jgi:hypothetical protein
VGPYCLGGYPAAVDYPDQSNLCPHCHRAAAFDLVHRVRITPEFAMIVAAWDTDLVKLPLGPGQTVERKIEHAPVEVCLVVFRCQGCRRSSVFHEHRIEFPASPEQDGQPRLKHWFDLSYPKRPPRQLPGESVPKPVRSFYEEGGVAEAAGARRAAAAMFRGSVEAICDALGVPRTAQNKSGKEYPRKLRDRVDDLATKGVDADIVADLHEARLVGNDSLHDGLVYSADELADVAELIADAVKLAFIQPAEKQAMREKRSARREVNRAQTGMVRG